MTELLAYPFMQRALLAGAMLGLVAGYLGAFVVQRRMSFLGNGLAHAAFGGVALSVLLGIDPLWPTIAFTLLVAVGIQAMQNHGGLTADTSIGVFFSVSMALGVIFLGLREGASTDAFSYLFGDILLLRWTDVAACALLLLLLVPAAFLWPQWAYATFDAEQARVDGLKLGRDDLLLTLALAVVIVVALKIVGILLVGAFLVIPAAAARVVSPTFAHVTVVGMIIGLTTAVVGLVASWPLDLPSGATIIVLQALVLFALLPFGSRLRQG